MYPGKTVHRDLARWKGLAPKEAALLKAHVLLSHRLYCERVPTEKKNSWKIPETPRTMPGGWALLAARLFKPDVPPNPQSLSNMLAGQATGYAKLPLPEFTGDLPRGRNGHSAHSMRHLGAQLVRLGIQRYCDENGIRDVRASAIADIVLDHDVREDRYGYADLNSEPGRERWVRIAACATSRLLWTDDGARRAPDVGAYEQALREGERLEDELRVLESRRATARRHRPSSVSEELSALREVVSLGDETEAVRQELEATRGECERLQGRDAWRVLHAGSPEDPAESDPQEALANTRRRVLDRPRAGRPRPRLARVREFLTVGEFAELWARSPASVRRLLSRNKQRARSWPFNLDVAPVDASRGPRRRRIWVGGVRADILERVPTAQLDRILSQDPQGWSASDVVAPLELPEPYATLFSGAPDRTTTPSGVHLKLVAENG
jgi:hypothetical protein